MSLFESLLIVMFSMFLAPLVLVLMVVVVFVILSIKTYYLQEIRPEDLKIKKAKRKLEKSYRKASKERGER